MEKHGTKFVKDSVPVKLEKRGEKIVVTYLTGGEQKSEQFDTVLFAIGHYAFTSGLNLENAEVISEKNGKFKVYDVEQTNVPNIYAIGDVIYGQLELTPTAIKAGMLFSKRLFAGATEKMDYINVPTTVFTPLEYGFCSYSEEDAKEKYGADKIITYHI